MSPRPPAASTTENSTNLPHSSSDCAGLRILYFLSEAARRAISSRCSSEVLSAAPASLPSTASSSESTRARAAPGGRKGEEKGDEPPGVFFFLLFVWRSPSRKEARGGGARRRRGAAAVAVAPAPALVEGREREGVERAQSSRGVDVVAVVAAFVAFSDAAYRREASPAPLVLREDAIERCILGFNAKE